MKLKAARVAAVIAIAAAGVSLPAASAGAGVAQSAVVTTNPADFTPNLAPDTLISHPAAYALEQSGATMYVGGQFDALTESGSTTLLTRKNFAAFDATTGALSSFAPVFNGNVWAIRAYGSSIYAAGEFTTVNGVTGHRGLVKIDATTGTVDPVFKAPWSSGKAYDLQIVAGRLIVAGTFPGALLALDPTTGANTGYLNLGITGTCVSNSACGTQNAPAAAEPTHVYRFAVSNDGTRLVAIGNFVTPHPRAFMVDLGTTTAALDGWYYAPLAHSCALPKVYPAYLRDVDFSPDGRYCPIAVTGYVVNGTLNPANPTFSMSDPPAACLAGGIRSVTGQRSVHRAPREHGTGLGSSVTGRVPRAV